MKQTNSPSHSHFLAEGFLHLGFLDLQPSRTPRAPREEHWFFVVGGRERNFKKTSPDLPVPRKVSFEQDVGYSITIWGMYGTADLHHKEVLM